MFARRTWGSNMDRLWLRSANDPNSLNPDMQTWFSYQGYIEMLHLKMCYSIVNWLKQQWCGHWITGNLLPASWCPGPHRISMFLHWHSTPGGANHHQDRSRWHKGWMTDLFKMLWNLSGSKLGSPVMTSSNNEKGWISPSIKRAPESRSIYHVRDFTMVGLDKFPPMVHSARS